MASTYLLLNDQLITITSDMHTIQKLNEDDAFLANYVNNAAKSGQFHFLFTKDPSLRRIVVKRVPLLKQINNIVHPLVSVWTTRGRPSDHDTTATILLLKLRNSAKYMERFSKTKDSKDGDMIIWEDLAQEMRSAGYDVYGEKCAQKFSTLLLSFQKKDPRRKRPATSNNNDDMDNYSEVEDDEWLPNGYNKSGRKKRKLQEDQANVNVEMVEMLEVLKKRNELMERKLNLQKQMLLLLGELLKKFY